MNRFSRFIPIGFLMLSLIPSRASCQTSRFAGDWTGTLRVQGVSLRLVYHITHSDATLWKATMDSPDQGVRGIAADSVTVTDAGDLYVGIRMIGGFYSGAIQPGDSVIVGTWNQAGSSFPVDLRRETSPPVVNRPQEPKPPLPCTEEEVTFVNAAAGITLAGTLTRPNGPGPFPAAVLISGSGPQDRNETVFGHKPFLVIADHLTRAGFAVLRYDDRGVAKSTGDFASATSVQFADDAHAAVALLRSRADIAADRIGLIGHSEGGIIAPMTAAKDPRIGFVVLLAAPAINGAEIIILQDSLISLANGATPEQIATSRAVNRRLFGLVASERDTAVMRKRMLDVLEGEAKRTDPTAAESEQAKKQLSATVDRLVSPWFRFFLTYDPMPALRALRCPVLALNGEKDLQVPVGVNLNGVRAALSSGGNTRFVVEAMPGLNHLFQTASTGSPLEYGRIEETFAPAALEKISSWMRDNTR